MTNPWLRLLSYWLQRTQEFSASSSLGAHPTVLMYKTLTVREETGSHDCSYIKPKSLGFSQILNSLVSENIWPIVTIILVIKSLTRILSTSTNTSEWKGWWEIIYQFSCLCLFWTEWNKNSLLLKFPDILHCNTLTVEWWKANQTWSKPGVLLHTESHLVLNKSKFSPVHLKKAKESDHYFNC